MDKVEATISAVFTSLIGLAILAVLLSKNSNTAGVVSGLFSGLAGVIQTAVAPITGGTSAPITIGTGTVGSGTSSPSIINGNGSGLNLNLSGVGGLVNSLPGLGQSGTNAFDGAGVTPGNLLPTGTDLFGSGTSSTSSAFDGAGITLA